MHGRTPLRALAACGLALVAACSHEVPPPPADVPEPLLPLYATILESREAYEAGLARIVAGDAVTGRDLLAAATDRLEIAAQFCARTDDCDAALFRRALGDLLAPQRRELPEVDDGVRLAESLGEALPALETSVALLTVDDLRARIPQNDRVQAALNDWLTWDRPTLLEAYRHYRYLRPKIAPVFEQAGLPEALLFAMIAKESGGKVHAYSSAGAVGPLQFMHHTARRFGLRNVDGFDERLDPVLATAASARYLDEQFRVFSADLEKVLAAYNGGENRLRRLDRRHHDATFWDPQMYYALPRETRRYVPQVLAAASIFLDPERYAVSFPALDATTSGLELVRAASLGELTICVGDDDNAVGWFRTLRNLNPQIDPADRLPPGTRLEVPSQLVPRYAARCMEESPLVRLAAELHATGYPARPDVVPYTVRPGDTLAEIAARHGCNSLRSLAALNGIRGPSYTIHPSQRLEVPDCG